MRKVKVNEVASLDSKETIPSIQGTLVRVWDYKTGEGDDGAWSFQTASLKDETGEIKLILKNQDNIKSMLNREILLSSHSGPKGLSGLYAEDNEWPKDSGKFTRQIKVTATAKITLIDASSKAAEGSVTRPDEKVVSGQPDAVSKLKHGLMRVLNAFYMIEKGVKVQVENSRIDGIDTTDENFGGKCAQAYRTLDSMGLIQALPDKPLWGAQKQLEEKPIESDWDDEVPF